MLDATPEDRRFRRMAWTVVACALLAFWIVMAGLLAMVLS